MPRKRNVQGQCQICGDIGKLSFEHVPNEAAYNHVSIVEYSWEDKYINKKARKGRVKQKGMGDHTLCEKCNNNTGHWYGAEYTKWAKSCFEFLRKRRSSRIEPDVATITLHNVYPLRFLKQVIVCFFSVSLGLAQAYPQLTNYVLQKENKDLPADCRFFINFYFGKKPKAKAMASCWKNKYINAREQFSAY